MDSQYLDKYENIIDSKLILEVFKKLDFYLQKNEKRPIILCLRNEVEPVIFNNLLSKKKLNIYQYVYPSISTELPIEKYYRYTHNENINIYIFKLINRIKEIVKKNTQFNKIFFRAQLGDNKKAFYYLNKYLKTHMPNVLISFYQ